VKEFEKETYENLVEAGGGATQQKLFILLGKVQDTFGYVPRDVVSDLAARTGVSEARIYGALTCYRDFKVGESRFKEDVCE
jgi:NADH:ubiquinone oxidoreductase subunit E